MAVDVSRFHQVFFEETSEHLTSLESLLLKLDPAHPNAEDLNAIFRAAHSIKGGAATFGFSDLAKLTHALETVLDQVRKGERAVNSELITLCLTTGDVLKAHLTALQSGGHSSSELEADILRDLEQAAAGHSTAEQRSSAPAAPSSVEPRITQSSAAPEQAYVLTVRLSESEMALPDATASVLEGVKNLGQTELLDANAPGQVRLRLHCAVAQSELVESLSFIWPQDRFSLTADVPGDAASDTAAAATQAPVQDDSFGFFPENMPDALARTQPIVARIADPGRRHYDRDVDQPKFGRRAADRLVTMGVDANSIRVGVEKVDRLVNLVGELVISQAMLAQTAGQLEAHSYDRLGSNLTQLDRHIRELHEAIMAIRMLPISYVFNRLPRVVRDLAFKLQKQVEIEVSGEETELDKGLIEKITDPLTHLVRNSVDHGIEAPEVRAAHGKPMHGTIRVNARHQGGNVVIEVEDDGAGLDRAKILAKAREQAMALPDSPTDQEVWQLVFLPGFSTAEQVTDVSGRGVGMDVVRRNIEALSGRVELTSRPGNGTRVSIRLPLTLAILDGMLVSVAGQIYVIALSLIVENLQARREDVKSVSGRNRLVKVREDYLPLIPLAESLGASTSQRDHTMFVICEVEDKRAALQVDEVIGQGQFVIKSLEHNFRKVAGLSGATILGDGRVALILDIATLLTQISADDAAPMKQVVNL